ncbi:MAG: hypothetical protein RSB71_03915 [Bacilli bacterium]
MKKEYFQWCDDVCSKNFKRDYIKELIKDLTFLKQNYNLSEEDLSNCNDFLTILDKLIEKDLTCLTKTIVNKINLYLSLFEKIIAKIWQESIDTTHNFSLLVHSFSSNDFLKPNYISDYKNNSHISCSYVTHEHFSLYNENTSGIIIGGDFNIIAASSTDAMTFVDETINFKTIAINKRRFIACWEPVTSLKTPTAIIKENISYKSYKQKECNYNEIIIDPIDTYAKALFCLENSDNIKLLKQLSLELQKPLYIFSQDIKKLTILN